MTGWKIRPDCIVPECEAEQGIARKWCRDHDPERCTASLSDRTLRVDIADRTCRNRSAKGSVYCNRHLKTAKDSQ